MYIQVHLRLNITLYLYGMYACLIKTLCLTVSHLRQLAPSRGRRRDVVTNHMCNTNQGLDQCDYTPIMNNSKVSKELRAQLNVCGLVGVLNYME